MSAEFPARSLLSMADWHDKKFGVGTNGARDLRQAVKAHRELADRLLRERIEWSIQTANYRARLREIDPAFPADTDPNQLSIDA